MREKRRYVTSKLVGAHKKFASVLQTQCFHAWAWLWGIELGANAQVEGWPILFRVEGSKITVGKNLYLRSSPRSNFAGPSRPCYLAAVEPEAQITIGDDCGFTSTVISARLSITLGNRVMCGVNTTITDNDWHHLDPALRRESKGIPAAAVVIEDNVWLGMNCTVLKGVRIGRDTVVAAGSVVVSDLPPGVVAAGIPARPRKSLYDLNSRNPEVAP